MKIENKLQDILLSEFSSVYCDTCKFKSIDEEESENKYGYYGCGDCYRKHMNWELSEEYCANLVKKIVKQLDLNKKERL